MSGRPEVWLSDLLKALTALDADPELAVVIASLLGLEPVPPRPVPPAREPRPGDEPGPVFRLPAADGGPARIPGTGPEPGEDREAPAPEPRVPAVLFPPLVRVSAGPPPAVDWEGTPTLPERTTGRPARALEPLLPPRAAPAVLRGALATRTPVGGAPDVGALVDAVARGVACRELPRVPRSTLRFGVQVLVDLGDGMAAFADDQEAVVDQLGGLIGVEHLEVLYFADCPLRGAGRGGRAGWLPYRPPARGTRVLLLSDLGRAGRAQRLHAASVRDWRGFLDRVHRAQCTAVALVPFPAHRVPSGLRNRLAVLPWDRRTTAAAVAAELRKTRNPS
ncbi:hypothetical protein ACH4F6_23795 [Streptomyces sp. NPDC017936]|uniref:hypothetical protein n=1 Tax=Streptomyces sp. NPDC017936 TaxID=3365016 RepID=UPI0037B7158A